jgi:undecaprenyl-diphosphatase
MRAWNGAAEDPPPPARPRASGISGHRRDGRCATAAEDVRSAAMELADLTARGRRLVTDVGPREVALLLAALIAGTSLWLFTEVADEVMEGEARAFDRAILLALRTSADRADPIGPAWFEDAARDVTALGSVAVLTLVTVAAIGYLVMIRRRGAALLLASCVGGGVALSSLLKALFGRPRPDLVAHGADVFTASFPSGHAMLSTVTYLTLAAVLARLQPQHRVKVYLLAVGIVVALLVGASRVYLGVHWPTDVVAGWSLGAAWATGAWGLALALQVRARRRGESQTPD